MCNKPADTQNNKTLKISFIVTTYNIGIELLRECLLSILQVPLNPTEREIILVDDGSDVTPLKQLGEMANEIVYIRQHNEGLSSARNTGLRVATGNFIQFVDGDDMLIPTAYQHCIDIIRNSNNDMVMFEMTDTLNQHPHPRTPAPPHPRTPMQGSLLMMNHNIKAAACGYIFKRSILGELRFTKGIYHEDEEFTPLLILRAESVTITDAKAYYYRKREGSITNNYDKKKIEKRLNDFRDIIIRLRYMADRLPTADRQALQRRVSQLTMDYIYNVATITHDGQQLDEAIKDLRKNNLFPLPERDYTLKYKWFRRVVETKLGRKMLLLARNKK